MRRPKAQPEDVLQRWEDRKAGNFDEETGVVVVEPVGH